MWLGQLAMIDFLLLIPENHSQPWTTTSLSVGQSLCFYGDPLTKSKISVGKQTPQKREEAKFLMPSLFQYLQLADKELERGRTVKIVELTLHERNPKNRC